jgi:AbrB family looped-hinge helix DNA binding protein
MALYPDRSNDFIRARVKDAGRVVIPAELRREFGIEDGEEILFSRDEHGIRITPVRRAVKEAQDFFSRLADPSVSLSDELLRDRRAEEERD